MQLKALATIVALSTVLADYSVDAEAIAEASQAGRPMPPPPMMSENAAR